MSPNSWSSCYLNVSLCDVLKVSAVTGFKCLSSVFFKWHFLCPLQKKKGHRNNVLHSSIRCMEIFLNSFLTQKVLLSLSSFFPSLFLLWFSWNAYSILNKTYSELLFLWLLFPVLHLSHYVVLIFLITSGHWAYTLSACSMSLFPSTSFYSSCGRQGQIHMILPS